LWAFAISTVVSIALLPLVQFDFNPLHLKNPHAESMSTLDDIVRDPDETPNTIDALAPNLAAAKALGARLEKLPEVAQAVTLASFGPDAQPAKLAAISDAQLLLDPTLNPFETQPAPSDAEVVQSLKDGAAKLRAAAGAQASPAAADARRLADALDSLASGP